MNIDIIELPVERWREYKELRLSLLKLFPQAYAASYEEKVSLPDEKWQQDLEEAKEEEQMLLFAEVEGKLVGSVGAYFYDHIKEKHKATPFGMGVLPEFQNKGIGRKLMQAILEKILTRPGIRQINLDVNTKSEGAIHLYQSLGFEKVGEFKRELMIEDTFHDVYEMEMYID